MRPAELSAASDDRSRPDPYSLRYLSDIEVSTDRDGICHHWLRKARPAACLRKLRHSRSRHVSRILTLNRPPVSGGDIDRIGLTKSGCVAFWTTSRKISAKISRSHSWLASPVSVRPTSPACSA